MDNGNVKFMSSFVYGLNSAVERRHLWHELGSRSLDLIGSPWIVLGDFNAIREPKDRFGGSQRWPPDHDDFPNFIEKAHLEDLRFRGIFFTWQTTAIRRKIDRVLVNDLWIENFRFFEAEFLPHILSDHTPMLVGIGTKIPMGPKPFKFFDSWSKFDEFLPTIREAWSSTIRGNKMAILYHKLRCTKEALTALVKKKRSDFSIAAKTRADAFRTQVANDVNPTEISSRILKEARLDTIFLDNLDESDKKQKSRVQWLQLGYRNNKYFHKSMNQRYNSNRIKSISDGFGNTFKDPDSVKFHIVEYFIRF